VRTWQTTRRTTEKEARTPIHYRYQENGGKGSALNTGLSMTNGDIIITIDGDCLVDQHAIAEFVEEFRDPRVMASVGNVKIGETKSLIGLIQYMEFLFSFYFKKGDSVMNSIYIIGGAAGAFRRSLFDQLGGYSTTNVTEDIELSMRIQEAGMRITYASKAIIFTEGAADLSGLMKQRLRWKRGRLDTFRSYLHMFFSMRPVHSRPLTFFVLPLAAFSDVQISFEPAFLLFLYFYSLMTGDFTSFLSGIIVVSSMFFVQVFFDEPATRKLSFILLAPITWLLFYVVTLVEWNALIRAVHGYLRGKEVRWQRWERRGVHST
jgi:poly-beta-1,6-N-acetyl-D-glucosamine synthase